jgi:hypothetical protein
VLLVKGVFSEEDILLKQRGSRLTELPTAKRAVIGEIAEAEGSNKALPHFSHASSPLSPLLSGEDVVKPDKGDFS